VIRDQARTLERVTAELRWHGLDDAALTVRAGYEAYEKARRGDKSWPKYRRWFAPMLIHLGGVPCLQVSAERWAEHRAMRQGEKCGRWNQIKAPSSTSLDLELMVAKMLFRWLVRAGKLPRNPLELARKANEPNGRETFLAKADVQRLIDGADVLLVDDHNHKDERRVLMFRAFVAYKFGCFLRINEARMLRRDQIGPDGLVELSAKATKGKKRRTVAMPAHVLEAVRAVPPLASEPYVFSSRWAKRVRIIGENTLREWFYKVCRATGVETRAVEGERVVPHVLRHSAASHAEEMGAHPMEIRDALGHASIATTERYLHRRPAQRARRMAELMGGRAGPQRQPSD